MSYFIAMQNRRATASYFHPQTIISERNEFLIVTRWGRNNEYLSISSAGVSSGLEGEAPEELIPDLVIFATLVSQGFDGGEIFLIEREMPEGLDLKGRFVGGDGYILLRETADDVAMTGTLRFRPGSATRIAGTRCVMLAANEPGATLHFWASYVPWSREILPADFDEARRIRPVVGQ